MGKYAAGELKPPAAGKAVLISLYSVLFFMFSA